MSDFNIEVEGGKAVRLPTAGKYCDRDIVVTATGGGSAAPLWVSYFTVCTNMFDGAAFPKDTELVMDLPNNVYGFNYMFRNVTGLTNIKLITHGEKTVTSTGLYMFASNGVRKVDLSEFNVNINNWTNGFYGAEKLEELIGLRGSGFAQHSFYNCTSLKELRCIKEGILSSIYLGACKALSDESIQSIIDGLADLTGATAQTLTLHATVGANLTQAQKDAVSAKNWTLVY